MKFSEKWELSTIPDLQLNAETARRRALKRVYKPKLSECERCHKMLSATELRYRCPEHTPPAARGVVTVRSKATKVPRK
jgi:hypothetical protein